MGLQIGLFPSSFHTNTIYVPLAWPKRATCPPISFSSILSLEHNWARYTDH